MSRDNKFMLEALKEAKKAYSINEVPVGAIIVNDKLEIIGRGHNKTETLNQATRHAEMEAINMASISQSSWRLEDCTIYVTLEPCLMCTGAILESRIKRVVYASTSKNEKSLNKILPFLTTNINIKGGVKKEECDKLINCFFKELRENNKSE